ncbi:hypothetical protein [Streptomyces aureocirculatus]|uniref:hypothetical protein n=1 Tax=Streptomyces aureocirculatus TaxID=67275 RepID=UPI0004C53144|nr:hypothetical protein [Streptomyces aureocirculatus]
MIEDPGRAWIALAAFVIPHIGLYYLPLRTGSRTGRHVQDDVQARAIIVLGLIGGVSLAVIIGWGTGFFVAIASTGAGLWNDFMGWINSPLRWEHLLAGAGVLIVPVIVLVLIFAVADG